MSSLNFSVTIIIQTQNCYSTIAKFLDHTVVSFIMRSEVRIWYLWRLPCCLNNVVTFERSRQQLLGFSVFRKSQVLMILNHKFFLWLQTRLELSWMINIVLDSYWLLNLCISKDFFLLKSIFGYSLGKVHQNKSAEHFREKLSTGTAMFLSFY